MRQALFAFFLLSSCAAPFAWAEPGARDSLRISPLQDAGLEHGEAQATQSARAEAERRRLPQFELPEYGYAQSEMEGGAAPDHGRKAGRLSPEERRALRRQINEAGNDLYVPRR